MSEEIRSRPDINSPDTAEPLRQWALEGVVTLYTVSTMIEGALFSFGSTRIARLIAPILILVVLANAAGNRLTRFSNWPLLGLFGIFALVGTVSLTTDITQAQVSTRITTSGALLVVGAALAAALAVLGPRGITSVQRGMIIGGALVSLAVILSHTRGQFVGAEQYQRVEGRSTAGLADPNDLALILAVALPAALFSRHRAVRYLLVPAMIAAIFFTGSRGGLVALGVSAAASAAVVTRVSAHPLRQAIGSAALTLGAVLGIWTLLPDKLTERFLSLPEEVTRGTMTGRTLYWRGAWQQFSENPFWGSGAGTAQYLNYLRTGKDNVFHNTYLTVLVELGALGGTFLAIALSAAWIGATRVRKSIPWPLASLAAMTVGMFGLSWDQKKLMWLLLITCGALLAAARQHRTAPPETEESAANEQPPHNLMIHDGSVGFSRTTHQVRALPAGTREVGTEI